jgi:hypothetical protein
MIAKKLRSLSIVATLLTIFLLLGAACLEAQNITGSILGLVTDPSGAVIPGASVELTNTNTGLVRKVTTSGHVGTTLGSRPISSFPLLTRNFVDLFDLTTGVTEGTLGENLQEGLP